MPRWMWRGAKKEVPKKTVVFLRHFYAEIIPRNPPSGQVVFIAQKTTVFFGNEHDAHRGDEMNTLRKIFMVVICAVLTANAAMAASWTVGKNNECYRKGAGWYKNVKYYYCGKQTKSCAGLAQTAGMQHEFFYESEANNHFTRDGTTYWCCGGTRDKAGEFKTGDKRYTTEEKEKSVGGGTCKYTVTTDICGPVTGEECMVPTECPSGQVVRDGKCVACSGEDKGVDASGNCKTCASGQIWDSGTKACKDKPQEEESASEETESSDESGTETAQCQSPEYLSPKSGKCVSKSAAKQYSRDMFDSCYACPTDTRFKRCLDFFRNPPTKLKESDKKVLVSCNIDPAEYDSDAAGKSKFRLIDKLGKLGGKGKTSSVPAKGKPENSLQQSAYRDNVGTAVDYEF